MIYALFDFALKVQMLTGKKRCQAHFVAAKIFGWK